VALLRLSHEIARPPHDVFAVVVNGAEFATWNPTIRASRAVTDGRVGPGSTFEWDLRGFGWVRQRLEDFEQDRRVRIVPELRSVSGGHRFTLTDMGGRTRVDHELEMTPRGWYRLLGPMMTMTGRINLKATAEALRQHLEG
jgi:uncharacterized protein YndB with AHSA1/START domain